MVHLRKKEGKKKERKKEGRKDRKDRKKDKLIYLKSSKMQCFYVKTVSVCDRPYHSSSVCHMP